MFITVPALSLFAIQQNLMEKIFLYWMRNIILKDKNYCEQSVLQVVKNYLQTVNYGKKWFLFMTWCILSI